MIEIGLLILEIIVYTWVVWKISRSRGYNDGFLDGYTEGYAKGYDARKNAFPTNWGR